MAPHLLFDPDCGFCERVATRMGGWGLSAVIEPLGPRWLDDPRIDRERARREIPFVDGTSVVYGAGAFAAVLQTGPLPWRVAGALIAGPLAPAAGVVYRWVAAHRHQLPGSTRGCRLPD